tara:strand:- start:1391 stop:2353 length:963 start_codon:yes stop_codon:yes gene_type:complete
MKKIVNYIKLIRPLNLIIIIILQCIIKFFLINEFIINPALSNINFIFFLLSTILITAAGYIINDIYDEKSDKINRDNKRIINKNIDSRIAIIWYCIFNILAFILIFYVSWIIKKPTFSLIFLYSIFILWKYSKSLKIKLLRGNFVVSWLIALSIINLGLFDIIPVMGIENSSIIIFKIIIVYSIFSFFMTLSREIIKDVEDKEGDILLNANTVILKYGLKKTKLIINLINTFVLLMIGYWQYFQYSLNRSSFENNQKIEVWGTDINSIIYTVILQFFVFIFIYKTYFAKIKKDFSFLSRLSKVIMILGIFSILFFTKNFI